MLSCTKNNESICYAAFYNYSEHADLSFCEIELVLPVPLSETKSGVYNNNKECGAELITNTDTICLKYIKSYFRERFFKRLELGLIDSQYSSYILSMPNPFEQTSLFQADSLFLNTLRNVKTIRYLDTNGVFHSINNVQFRYYYLFNGKQISKDSKEYFQKMHFTKPPLLYMD